MQDMEAAAELQRLHQLAAGALDDGERVTTLVGVVTAAEAAAAGLSPAGLCRLPSDEALVGSLDLFWGGSAPPETTYLCGESPRGLLEPTRARGWMG
jgi:hypothetical protein